MPISSLNTTESALRTAILRHDGTAHNVANVNTAGYRSRTPLQTDLHPAGTRIAAIRPGPHPARGLSGTDLVEESKEQILNSITFSANIQAAKVSNRMTGELLDLIG